MNPNFGDLLKKAQEMQTQMQQVREQLANITVEGSAGGGMVKVTANCQNRIVKVDVEPEVIDPADPEMLEDLIVAAVNQALEKAQTRGQEEMQKVLGPVLGNLNLGGLNLPGM